MKNSGIEWIGLIPTHWKIGKVKNWYKMNTGFTPDTKKSHYYDDESGYDWVTISDMTEKTKFISHTKSKISEDYLTEKNPIITKKGSLLYSFKLSVGKVAFAGKDIYTNEAIASFIPTSNVNLNFLFYSSSLIYGNANTNIYGAKLLNSELILNAPIIYPPLSEQQAIADFLDDKCTEIDNLSAAITEQIEVLKQYKKSVITEAITKGLDPTAPMKDSGIEWIGDIPKNNTICNLKYLISNYKAGPFGSSLITSNLLDEGSILIYTPEHIAEQNTNLQNNLYLPEERFLEMSNFLVQENDIVFPIVGSLGRAMLITKNMPKGIINQRLAKFKIDNTKLSIRYFMWMFGTSDFFKPYIETYSRGSIIVNLTKQIIGNIPIIITSLPEQEAIADYLDDKCAQIDSVIKDKETQLETLAAYKKSLIYEYVTGKKEVPQLKEV